MSTFKPGDPRTISCGRKGAAVTKPVVKRDPDGKFTTRAPKKEPA